MSQDLQLSETVLAKLNQRGLESAARRGSGLSVTPSLAVPTANAVPCSPKTSSPRQRSSSSQEEIKYIEVARVTEKFSPRSSKDLKNKTVYTIHFIHGEDLEWDIERNMSDILEFSAKLTNLEVDKDKSTLPSLIADTSSADEIKEFIKSVIVYFGQSIWNYPFVLTFLDDFAFQSATASIRIQLIQNELSSVISRNRSLISQVYENQNLTLAVYDIMRVLQFRVSELEHHVEKQDASNEPTRNSFTQILPNRDDIPAEQFHSVIRSISLSQRNDHFESTRNSLESVLSEHSTVSVRTSVESAMNSWPRSNIINHITSIPRRETVDATAEFSEYAESPVSQTVSDISPKFSSDFAYDYANSPSSAIRQPPIGENIQHSSLNENFNNEKDQEFIRNANEDEANDISLIASSLAAAPSQSLGLGLKGFLDSGFLGDQQSFFDFSNFEGSDIVKNQPEKMTPSSMNTSNESLIGSLPSNLIPVNDTTSTCDEVVEELLSVLVPHEPQLVYRSSAKSFLLKQIRRALGSRAFEVGLHSLRCFLPDDPLRLTVILWKNHSGHWHTHLSDRLCRLSESGKIVEDELIDQNYDDIPSHMDHSVFNVSYASGNAIASDFRVYCVVDTLPVEISSNGREDLCLLAFFEEIAILVGKNNLFKRSVVLIRAWWAYETTTYIGSPIKHYIPDFAMIVMVGAIFNKYHDRIYFPFQALCYFFAEFSEIDWSNSVISIQGILSLKPGSDQVCLPSPDPKHLVQSSLLDKYWDIVNITADTPEIASETTAETASVSSPDKPLENSKPDDSRVESESGIVDLEGITKIQASTSDKVSSCRKTIFDNFERRAINIINPVTYVNMMNDKLNPRRSKRITKAFAVATKNLHAVLKLSLNPGVVSVQTAIKNFFRTSTARFGSGWRPDVLGNTIWIKSNDAATELNSHNPWGENWCDGSRSGVQSNHDKEENDIRDDNSELSDYSRDLMKVSLERVWDEILYCSLVLEGKITDTALLILTKEILVERGTLPVGEIGKMLQELTSMTSLSSKLKEKFGGLKKFLERFAEHFLIGSDHPFNPHVYLRQTLTSEDFEIINRGSVPPQLLAKFKKMVVVRKKKVNPLPPPPSNLDYGPWGGGSPTFGGISQVPTPNSFSQAPISNAPNNSQVQKRPSPQVPPKPSNPESPNNILSSMSPLMFQQSQHESKIGNFPVQHVTGLDSNQVNRLSQVADNINGHMNGGMGMYGRNEPPRDIFSHKSFPVRRKSNPMEEIGPQSIPQTMMSEPLGPYNQLSVEHMGLHFDEWNDRSRGPLPTQISHIRPRSMPPRNMYPQPPQPPIQQQYNVQPHHFDMIGQPPPPHRGTDQFYYGQSGLNVPNMPGGGSNQPDGRYSSNHQQQFTNHLHHQYQNSPQYHY